MSASTSARKTAVSAQRVPGLLSRAYYRYYYNSFSDQSAE